MSRPVLYLGRCIRLRARTLRYCVVSFKNKTDKLKCRQADKPGSYRTLLVLRLARIEGEMSLMSFSGLFFLKTAGRLIFVCSSFLCCGVSIKQLVCACCLGKKGVGWMVITDWLAYIRRMPYIKVG